MCILSSVRSDDSDSTYFTNQQTKMGKKKIKKKEIWKIEVPKFLIALTLPYPQSQKRKENREK